MSLIMSLIAILGGACISIQSAVNSKLSEKTGPYLCSLISFSVGAAFTLLIIILYPGHHPLNLTGVPKWKLLGACFGVPYIVIMTIALKEIGIATATVSVIFGQCFMSMLIDNFGWFGNPVIHLSANRYTALFFLIAGLYFMFRSEAKYQYKNY